MSSLFERLRAALASRYVVEQEVAAGGMGLVFLARDTALERRVAIKVLRPELATAPAAERFLREARILASLTHPNVIAVHDAGEADGIFYYTMDYVEGHSLAEHLGRGRGPLPLRQVLKVGRDLLDGLEAAHSLGVIHRDIKPGNVLLLHGRAILSDFGIAKPSTPHSTAGSATDPLHPAGTPGYMPPEQEFGGGAAVTVRTDLYAVGMLLYEALTGRPWSTMQTAPERADWSGVPRPVARVLLKALAWDPADRWSDAARFRRALWHTRVRPYVQRTILLTAGGVMAGLVIAWLVRPGPVSKAASGGGGGGLEIRLGPLPVRAGPPWVGESLLVALEERLSGLPEFQVVRDGRRSPDRAAIAVQGGVTGLPGDSLRVELRVTDGSAWEVRRPTAEWPLVADSLAHLLLIEVWSGRSPLASSLPVRALPRSDRGLAAWLRAEQLLAQARWEDAYRAYLAAAALDSTCWICGWRLGQVERWLGRPGDPLRIRRERAFVDSFPAAYQPLIRAAGQPLDQRLETLRAAVETYRGSFDAWFQLGDETFHRGPLVGRRRAEATDYFIQATVLRPDFAPAWEHLAWQAMAEGDSARAAEALVAHARLGTPRDPAAVQIRALLDVGFAWRFLSEAEAARVTQRLLATPGVGDLPDLAAGPRYLPSFDAPRGAVVLGRLFAGRRDRRDLARSGLLAQALGYLALGRTDSMRLALATLADRFSDRELRAFATELEGLLQLADGTAGTGQVPGSRQPALLVQGAELGRQGRWADALRLTRPLQADTTSRHWTSSARATLHLLRADWFERVGDDEAARDELRWHEALDLAGYPTGAPHAGEVDWAMGTVARWRRAAVLERLRGAGGTQAELCACYRGVVRHWSGGEPRYAARADSARRRLAVLDCGSEGEAR